MENILPGDLAAAVVPNVENAEEFSPAHIPEEIILYDECGDTQWDKVLIQHDLAHQLSKVSKDIKK